MDPQGPFPEQGQQPGSPENQFQHDVKMKQALGQAKAREDSSSSRQILLYVVPVVLFLITGSIVAIKVSSSFSEVDQAFLNAYSFDEEKWFSCHSDRECTVVKGPCNEPVGIKKSYEEGYKQWRNGEVGHYDCSTVESWELHTLTGVCRNKQCLVYDSKAFAYEGKEDPKTLKLDDLESLEHR